MDTALTILAAVSALSALCTIPAALLLLRRKESPRPMVTAALCLSGIAVICLLVRG